MKTQTLTRASWEVKTHLYLVMARVVVVVVVHSPVSYQFPLPHFTFFSPQILWYYTS